MSKLYKATVYIEDINDMFQDIEDIKTSLENKLDDLTFTFDDLKTIDTTEYLEEVGDNYEWNTTIEEDRIKALKEYLKKEGLIND